VQPLGLPCKGAPLNLRSSLALVLVGAAAFSCSSSAPSPCQGAALVANSGANQTVFKHTAVTLSGSAQGAHGTPAYSWNFAAIPAGSSAILAAPTSTAPTFTTDKSGAYVATLVAEDSCGLSLPATTLVSVTDRAPVAVASSTSAAMPGSTVTLDASASSDPDHDALTYSWTLLYQPQGSAVQLSQSTSAQATFVPQRYGYYGALLVVSDGELSSTPVEVTITVGSTGPTGACSPAPAPVASAGADQTSQPYSASTVTLDGSGSTSGRGPLTFKWSITSAPAGSRATLDSATAMKPALAPDKSGVYTLSLVVNDGCVDSAPAQVHVTRIGNPPYASAYANGYANGYGPMPLGLPVTVQGFGTDFEQNPLTYAWTLTSSPAASLAALANATSTSVVLTPDVAGTYTVSLVVSNGFATSTPAQVTFTAALLPPTASAGADRAGFVGAKVTLDGTASSDPEKRPLAYAWSLTTPSASTAFLSGASSATSTFTPDVPGVYVAGLQVTAGAQVVSTTVTIAAWPAIQTLSHKVLDAAYSKPLDRLVTIAAGPDALYVYEPRAGTEVTVALSAPAACLGLSPDGLFAAVGHNNAVSYVDLQAGKVSKVIPVSGDIATVAVGESGVLYAFPRDAPSDRVHIIAVPVAGGAQPSVTSALTGAPSAAVRPGAGTLYLTSMGYSSGSGIEEYSLSGSAPSLAAVPGGSYQQTCGKLWLSQSGTRLYSRCGVAFRASSTASEDLVSDGVLAQGSGLYTSLLLRQLDDSSAIAEVSAVASPSSTLYYNGADDGSLRRWSANGLGMRETLSYPSDLSSGTPRQWYGRFVFYRSDGSERYVVLQLDPAAGAAHDFGVVTY
jgi:chitinase